MSRFWIAAPTWSNITDTMIRIYGTPTKEGFSVFVVLWALGCFALHSLWQRGMRSVALLLASVGLLPVLLELLVSFLAMPVFLDRTLIYVNLPLYLAAAYGIRQIPVKSGVAAAVAVGMFAIALGSHYRDFKKEPWNEIAAYLSSALRPGEPALLLPNYLILPLEYYAARQGAVYRRVGVPENWKAPDQPRRNSRDSPPMTKSEAMDVTGVSDLIGASQKLALVMRRVDLVDPIMLVQQEVMKTHRIVETRKFENVTVVVFEAR